jgi:hypothetical protein
MLLLQNSQDLLHKKTALKIKDIRYAFWSDSIMVRQVDGAKRYYAQNEVWGYEDKDCYVYRNFDHRFFKVEEDSGLILYSTKDYGYKIYFTHYYFSKAPEAPIYTLNWKNIKKQFKDNPCFLEKLEGLKWYEDYADWDKNNAAYKFVRLYNECAHH